MEPKLNRKQLKLAARERMRETTPRPALVTVVFLLLTTGLATVVGLFLTDPLSMYLQYVSMGYSEDIALYYAFTGSNVMLVVFLNILIVLFSTVLGFGYQAWALYRSRGEEAGYGTLLTGFSMAGRVIGLALFVAVLSVLWYLAVMLPAVLLIAVIISVAVGVFESIAATVLGVILAVAIYIAAIVLAIALVLRYAMAEYALLDHPEDGIRAAVRRSKELMRGRKGFYVLLHLSFLGWYLLLGVLAGVPAAIGVLLSSEVLTTVLTFLVPLALELWLVPYVQITDANFYCAVAAEQEAAVPPSFPEL